MTSKKKRRSRSSRKSRGSSGNSRRPASVGVGWRYIEPHHRYAIVGLVPKKGGGYLKTRHVVARARDAYEALAELYRVREQQRAAGAYGQGRWDYVVLDVSSGKGTLSPIVTEAQLEARKARRTPLG